MSRRTHGRWRDFSHRRDNGGPSSIPLLRLKGAPPVTKRRKGIRRKAMRRTGAITLVAVVVSVIAGSITSIPAGAHARKASTPPMQVTLLADGLQGSVGATIGPDGALYVPEAELGQITRIDPTTGNATTFATGLPTREIFIGGAIDIAFVGTTMYVLVTVVGPDVGGNSVVGIYRLNGSGDFS